MPESSPQPAPRKSAAFIVVLAAAAWLVPGAGHLILRRWGRAAAYFAVVSALALLGLALRGHVFAPDFKDAFELLGFLSNVGAGIHYLAARFLEAGGPDVSRAAGDYGTRFFATAGVLNLLCVIDAVDIATGRKL